MTSLSIISAGINKIFKSKKVVEVATETVAKAVEKEVPKVKVLNPSETLAFGLPKPLDKDAFFKLNQQLFENDNLVTKLKTAGADESLVKHARSKGPLKYSPEVSLPVQYNKSEFKKFVDGQTNDRKIQQLLKEQEAQAQGRAVALQKFKAGYSGFEKTGITNPDEILSLIKSGEYADSEREMFVALAKTGTPEHAEKLVANFDEVLGKTLNVLNHSGFTRMEPLSNRIVTIGTIGNAKQKADLISKLQKVLTGTNNETVVGGVFNSIGRIGKNHPEDTKFAEFLLNHTFNSNQKLAYEQLANFDNQFHAIAHGMIQNPKNPAIMAAAYKSAKTPEQKEILANAILSTPQLKETSIGAAGKIYDNDMSVNYKADILSKVARPEQASGLSNFNISMLKEALSA